MKRLQELKDTLSIDKHDLDGELERQPQLYADAVEVVSDLLRDRDLLKEQQKQTYARIYNELLAENEKMADAKLIKLVEGHREYQELAEQLINMNADVMYGQGLLEALSQRAASIRRLADLHITGYFTTDTSTHERTPAVRSAPTVMVKKGSKRVELKD